jgi:hypothetical protein
MGYADTLENRRCDILIYGDSTALVGIDPAILEQRTGLSACNISEYGALTLVNHMQLVDDFLAHNPRPRFILFMFTPDRLNQPRGWGINTPTLEAISYLIRRQPPARAALMLASHPVESITWSETGMRLTLSHLHARPFPEATRHIREDYAGRFPIPESTRQACDDPTGYRVPPDPTWISDLRARYGQDGTRVLVDATPTAPCDPDLPYFQQQLNSLIDNAPYPTIPIDAFSTDGHLHVNHRGIAILSNMVADQIAAQIKAQIPAHAPPGGGS